MEQNHKLFEISLLLYVSRPFFSFFLKVLKLTLVIYISNLFLGNLGNTKGKAGNLRVGRGIITRRLVNRLKTISLKNIFIAKRLEVSKRKQIK